MHIVKSICVQDIGTIYLEAFLYRGQLTRGEIPGLLGTSERHARRITLALVDHEVLTSESTRAPLASLSLPDWLHAGCRGYFLNGARNWNSSV